ncbi:MAG: aspartate--ammonia ligase [Ruminococcaceae bacterium]|nr:aspartate--ammonia ligase [Oscillospiraceae bacterium]
MDKSYIPEGYVSVLDVYHTQTAIGKLRKIFEEKLSLALNLKRISAPLFVDSGSGLNDDLNGVERPVSFDIPAAGVTAQVVHSLAKWKRMALAKYSFREGNGLWTDMNAIRRDEQTDNIHSLYVDQWDWEKVIRCEDRTLDYLKNTVKLIVGAICDTCEQINGIYPQLNTSIERKVYFVTSQELEDMYPELTPKQRENKVAKDHGTVFIMQIGKVLRSGKLHDGRAPDYDDWELNGDILFYNPVLDSALEISSMGIRVDRESLIKQLEIRGCTDRLELPFHKMLVNGELPLTIGGGIGQSRLCMLLLGKAHVGEVQVSVWDSHTVKVCEEKGVVLL